MENNPIKFTSKNTDALKEAHGSLLSALNEYAKIKSLSHEDVQIIEQLINNQYQKKKIEYFLQERLFSFTNYIDTAINTSFNQENKLAKDKTYSNLFYLRHTKKFISE